jgi:hypothetical protein
MGMGETCGWRRGQVLVLVPVMVLVIGAMLALTVDVGRVVQEKAQIQNACDAGALAGARVLLDMHRDGKREALCRQAAEAEAGRFFGANSPESAAAIEFGCYGDDGSFASVDTTQAATLVRVTGARDEAAPGGKLPMLFASLIGLSDTPVRSRAVAEVATGVRGVLSRLAPFAIPVERVGDVGSSMTFYPGDPSAYKQGLGDDLIVPGNWGLLNLDGGSSSTQELTDWIENGTGSLVIPAGADYVRVDGTSGFRGALNKTVRDAIGQPIVVVVYDQVLGGGSNAQFRCIGFMEVTITDCKLTGKDPYATCRVDEFVNLHDLVTGGWTSPNVRKVQLVG